MPRKTPLIAATLVATVAGGLVLTQCYATLAARAEVSRLTIRLPGLTVGRVDVDAFGGRVALRDVAIGAGSLRVYAKTLDLPLGTADFSLVTAAVADPADRLMRLAQWPRAESPKSEESEGSGGGIQLKIPGQAAPEAPAKPAAPAQSAQSGTASASDVTIVDGTTTYVIKKIDLTGTSLTNADLTALLDPKSPDTIEARLRKFTANSIAISEITSDQKEPGGEFKTDATRILLADVARGKIGAASAAGWTMTGLGGKGAVAVKTGAIEASGLDLALITHLLDATRTDDSEPLKSLSESLTIHDVVLTNSDKNSTMTVATITQKDLKARPLKTDLKTLNDTADKDASGDSAAKVERSKAVADDITSSYEVGAFTIDKLAFSSTEKDQPVTMGITSIALQDFRARTLASFKVRNFFVDGPGTKMSVATFDLANVVIPVMSKTAADDASTALATDKIPAIAKGDIGQIAVDVETPRDDGTINKVKFAVAHVGSSSDQRVGRLPSQGILTIDNLTFDIPPGDNPGARELIAMGYQHLDLSGAISTAYDQALETLSIQKLLVSGVGMGSVNVAVDLGNVNKGIMSANPSVAKASALAMLLKRVDIRIENSGLFEKGLDWKAKQDGRTVEAERDQAIDFFAVKLPDMLGNGKGIKTIGTAVAKFIAEPKTLHVSAASKEGLGASDMGLIGAPDELLNRLDIKADANQ